MKGPSPSLNVLAALLIVLGSLPTVLAHDLEGTQVRLWFMRDGSFLLDVANNPRWLRDRMQSIPGPFADRIVLWVDGREIRPESVEFLSGGDSALHRVRGHMPLDAKTLRWYYGLVGDPYPMTIRRADERVIVEEIQGNAWSRPIDLSGQFHRTDYWPEFLVVGLLATGVMFRVLSLRRRLR